MRLQHSLHEFMPYGAPELLEASRPNLSRALVLSSSLTALAFVALASIVSRLPPAAIPSPVIAIPHLTRNFSELIQTRENPAPRVKITPPSRIDPARGVIEPVREEKITVPVDSRDYGDLSRQVQTQEGGSTKAAIGDIGPATTVDPDAPVDYVEELPAAVNEVKPAYPDIAQQAMVEGQVVVLVLVGRDGRVREAKVDQHRHVLMLDDAALEAARKWVFSPATVGGHPVAVWTAIPFLFRLN